MKGLLALHEKNSVGRYKTGRKTQTRSLTRVNGVTYRPDRKAFRVRVMVDRKNKDLGQFSEQWDAICKIKTYEHEAELNR